MPTALAEQPASAITGCIAGVIYHHVSASAGRHSGDAANFARLSELWRPLIQERAEERREAEIRRREWPSQSEADERSRRERRRDGWRYIKKHFWQPWQYTGSAPPGGRRHRRATLGAARGARAIFLRMTRPPHIYAGGGRHRQEIPRVLEHRC